MKKVVFLFAILLSVVGYVYAQHAGGGSARSGSGDTHLCMWSESAQDCIDGSDNYCICESKDQ